MVSRLIFIFLILSLKLFADEFIASVNRKEIHSTDSITLSLTLKDATAKRAPDIEPLDRAFVISSRHEQHSSIMINGNIITTKTWKYTLLPKREGQLEIPSIAIQTANGVISSAPIQIKVSKALPAKAKVEESNAIIANASLDNLKPYKNEPFILSVKVSSKAELANVQMHKIALENAIIELHGEPKAYRQVIEGVNVGTIDFEYLITPLKPGVMTIPKTIIQGMIASSAKERRNNLFDHDQDPFFSFMGFNEFKPFNVSTESIVIDVQPPHPDVNPWLAAKSLNIEEVWDPMQPLRVGEPIKRELTISAIGLLASQLPTLSDQLKSNLLYKVYNDAPVLLDKSKDSPLQSERKELYTIIPEKSGEWTMPELSIAYWDVEKKQKVVVKVPSRVLNILPAIVSVVETENEIAMITSPLEPVIAQSTIESHFYLYSIIAGLVFMLLAISGWAFILQKRLHSQQKPGGKTKREKLPDLNPT